MTTLRTVGEIEAALRDRTAVTEVLSQVDKGKKGTFTYVPWNETAKLLTQIFGTFGWSAKIIASHSDVERGIYVVDLDLEVRGIDDESGAYFEKHLPGRGMGIVSASELEKGSRDAHDTAGKAARSDALSVAAKSLGDAFGLFLYDKGDPARTASSTSSNGEQRTTQATTPATDTRAPAGTQPTKPSWYGGIGKDGKPRIGYASTAQAGVLRKNGWNDSQIQALTDYDEFKRTVDSQFGDEKITPPKTVQGGGTLHLVQPAGQKDEF
jgi:hypothetical protein